MKIQIPYMFTPREYQYPLMRAMDSGFRRAITIWHRRAGKDKCLWNLLIKKALQKKGQYYYFFPEYKQGKRVIWDGIDNDGFSFIDHIPEQLLVSKNSQEMKITLIDPTGQSKTGSIISIVGTDDYDKIRGSNPIGCVFSEYGYQNPGAWDVVRPILTINRGWAVFNSTPNGKNHMYKLWENVKDNEDWFKQLLTVEDTLDPFGNRYVTDEMIQEDRDAGYSDEMIQQEYYCDWTANSQGFYYLKYLEDAAEDQRITSVPHNSEILVDTWWDLGVGDNTAIWFTQTVGNAIHVIDSYSNKSKGLDHYASVVRNKPYLYRSHNFPFDIKNTELGSGRTRLETIEGLLGDGVNVDINVLPKLPVEDGINAVRVLFPRLYIDGKKNSKGLDALYNYHRQWDDKLKQYKNKPVHDWSADYADAFRYMAIGHSVPNRRRRDRNTLSGRLRSFKTARTDSWMTA